MSILMHIVGFISEYPLLITIPGAIIVLLAWLYNEVIGFYPGPNPFNRSKIRPPKPLVTDKAKRDGVLKQGKCTHTISPIHVIAE